METIESVSVESIESIGAVESVKSVKSIKSVNAKKPKTYVFHTDPGHGWLAVKRKELEALDLISKISSCSYQKNGTVYLEEDCDATLFLETLEAKKIPFVIKQSNNKNTYQNPSHIRNYPLFHIDNEINKR